MGLRLKYRHPKISGIMERRDGTVVVFVCDDASDKDIQEIQALFNHPVIIKKGQFSLMT